MWIMDSLVLYFLYTTYTWNDILAVVSVIELRYTLLFLVYKHSNTWTDLITISCYI